MKKLFPVIVLVFFGFAIFIAVLIFTGAIKLGDKATPATTGTVTMWGTVPSATLSPLISTYNQNAGTYGVTYVQKDPLTYENDLIQALASGKGPDLYLLTPALLWHFRDKISPIPYTTYPDRLYRDSFIDGASVFLTTGGVLALPFRADPLVMYYNKTMLASNFVVTPPAYWEDLFAFVTAVTKKDANSVISKSAISFGAWDNVVHAKDIIAMMLLQVDNPITKNQNGELMSTLDQVSGTSTVIPAQSVVTFYGEFANPVSTYYSWNEAKPSSRDAFIAGDLAVYFGYASELATLRAKNPNLDFDVALVPQVKTSTSKATYTNLYGIALSKFSKNPATSFTVARDLTAKPFQEALAAVDIVPPVRRDLLAAKPVGDAYKLVFYNSALIGRTWIDPDAAGSDSVFRQMIKSYTSGSQNARESVRSASQALNLVAE